MVKIKNSEYKRLKDIIERVQFEEYENIVYNGADILLFPCQQTRDEQKRGIPPIFFQSSDLESYNIYFSMNVVPVDFRKPCLLHEVLEIGVFQQLKFQRDNTNREVSAIAHQTARKYDLRYAREILPESKYQEYLNLERMLIRTDLPGLID